MLIAAVMIVYRVRSFGTVTLQSIFGAFSAYLVNRPDLPGHAGRPAGRGVPCPGRPAG
jgi:hypothetical protein